MYNKKSVSMNSSRNFLCCYRTQYYGTFRCVLLLTLLIQAPHLITTNMESLPVPA